MTAMHQYAEPFIITLPWSQYTLIFVLLNADMPSFANSVDPDLFAIQYLNLYQKPGSSNLIGWKFEVGMSSQFIQHDIK